MDKTYDPAAIEQKWYQHWEQNHYFAPNSHGKSPYCIMIPPPNVTGYLHMGHGFQYTLMDTLIRYHRMLGQDVLWQVGTDHAGISTQMVVERQLLAENISRQDLGREEFVKRTFVWKNFSGQQITRQMRRLGNSVDWQRERFTLDDGLSRAVTEVFIQLHAEGLIYRGKRLVNWDPTLLTAISDLEVIPTETAGHLWHIRYPLANGQDFITVATTRPETLLGDMAVAVHPDDERYQSFVGQLITLPLTDRQIPIIADDKVDPTFGSGCVKITPAHDFNDYQMGKRHQLELLNIFTPDAKLNENTPSAYRGLDRFSARKKIIQDLENLNLLEKTEKHTLQLPLGEKSGAVIEPYLTEQWYVRMEPLAAPAKELVLSGQIRFIPENWHKTYLQWLNNIEDWCISRQLWWGHRIPAWYDEQGNVFVGKDERTIRAQYQLAPEILLKQDEDVLDTWFSSALWPFSTLGWPEKTPDFSRYFPTNVLVTGFDIIFFWVARMVMMAWKFTGQVPFRDVYITGLIRDAEGQKMSKSKGNVLDPLDLIDGIDLEALVAKRTSHMMQPHLAEKIAKQTRKEFPEGIVPYGTDALRLTYCALATPGREIRFDIGRLSGYRHFCNKLWNAARFVLMNTEDKNVQHYRSEQILQLSVIDRYIIASLQQVTANVKEHLASYRFDLMAQALYDFTWYEFCDWYLELIKTDLQNEVPEKTFSARYTLLTTLETLCRLLHPVIPFITEEIWQRLIPLLNTHYALSETKHHNKSIMLAVYPETSANIDLTAINEVSWLKRLILAVRQIRSETRVSPAISVKILLRLGDNIDRELMAIHQERFMKLVKVSSITWISEAPPPAATGFCGNLEISIPLAGLIDKTAETTRLQKELDKTQKELEKCSAKLANSQFIDHAPAPVVNAEKSRHQELQDLANKLEQSLTTICALPDDNEL